MGMRGALGLFALYLSGSEEFEWLKEAVESDLGVVDLVFDIKVILDDEACALYDLLKRALRYDTENLLTVDEILRNPWRHII